MLVIETLLGKRVGGAEGKIYKEVFFLLNRVLEWKKIMELIR